MLENMPLCECGCGQSVKSKERKYLKGHYWKGRKRGKHRKEHNEKISRGVKLAYETEVVKNKQFKNTPKGKNHPVYGTEGYWKNKHHTEESKQKSSDSQKGEKHHFYKKEHKRSTKEKTSISCKNWWNTTAGKKQQNIQSNKMKSGQAAYCNFFIKNPSKPQVKLFNLCQEMLPYPIMNYPCLKYSILPLGNLLFLLGKISSNICNICRSSSVKKIWILQYS